MLKTALKSDWIDLPEGKMHFLVGGQDQAGIVVLVHGMVLLILGGAALIL